MKIENKSQRVVHFNVPGGLIALAPLATIELSGDQAAAAKEILAGPWKMLVDDGSLLVDKADSTPDSQRSLSADTLRAIDAKDAKVRADADAEARAKTIDAEARALADAEAEAAPAVKSFRTEPEPTRKHR